MRVSFLDRMRISLIPQDFDIDAVEGNGFEEIKSVVRKAGGRFYPMSIWLILPQ